MARLLLSSALLTAVLDLSATAANTYTNPIIAGDYPDPGAIYVNGTFYVATTGHGFPIHRSVDLRSWTAAGSVFGRSGGPTWASGDFWAPEIHKMPGSGGFVVYYTARDHDGRLSIGAATGAFPLGPFNDIGQPLARDMEGHGMYLDSHYFYDSDSGKGFLVWKRGTVTPPAETHTLLYMQELDPSGTKLAGARKTILENDLSSWEKGVVEAPWIVRPTKSDFYYLFYSAAHCCDGSGSYAVGVARSKSISGPYEKYSGNPILHSNAKTRPIASNRSYRKSEGFDGTGHCSVLQDPIDTSQWIIFYHAYARPKTSGHRSLMLDVIRFAAGLADADSAKYNDTTTGAGWPSIATNTGAPSVGPTQVPPTKGTVGFV